MTLIEESISFEVRLKSSFESALEMVTQALKDEGFGVLTEIDVKSTFKEKLDVDFRPYRIIGACNPPLAFRALSETPEVGLLLPCNVTVDQVDEDTVEVSLLDPNIMLAVVGDPAIQSIAGEASERLQRVAIALEKGI